MTLARKILGNTFWQIFGRVVTAIIAFITVGFLTNYWAEGMSVEYGQAKYGTYATIYEFLAIFGAIADLGIFTIAVREMSKKEEGRQEIFSATLSLRVISLVMAMALATVVAFLIPGYRGTEIPEGVAIGAFGTGLFILSGTLATVLLVHLRMVYHALGLVIGKIITFGAMIAIMFFFYKDPTSESFSQLMWAGVYGSAVTLLITAWYARKFISIRPGKDRKLMKSLFSMALPFGLAIFLNTVYFRLGITMMGIVLPYSDQATGLCSAPFCGDQQAGIYAVAVRIIEVIIIIPLYFMNSVLPSISSAASEEEKGVVKRRLSLTFIFLFFLALPSVVGIFLLAKPIVELVTPEDFGSDNALRILAIPLFFTFFTTFLNFVLIAFGEQKKILWINLGAVIINLLINLFALPRYGYYGAAIASLFSEGLILVAGLFFVLRIVRFPVEWKRLFGSLTAALFMGIFTYQTWKYWGSSIGKTSLVMIIPLSAVMYGGVLFVTKAIDSSMLRMFYSKKSDQKIILPE